MTLSVQKNEGQMTIAVEGKLDTLSAPELDGVLKSQLEGVSELVFDFKDLTYISSAGLRTLLSAQKQMNKQGSMKVIHVMSMIMEIFEVTGFQDIMTIE